MRRRVVLGARAERQLERLGAYIEERSGAARADSYTGRILSFCMSLSTFPERGTRRDDLTPGLRTIGFDRRVTIAFMVHSDVVAIVGIFYGGQNYAAALRGR